MTTYQNPIGTREHQMLALLQRAAVRLYFANKERIPERSIRENLQSAYELVSIALDGDHDDALGDAYLGLYDAQDSAVPILPADAFGEREPEVKSAPDETFKEGVDRLINIKPEPVRPMMDELFGNTQVRPEHVFSVDEMRRYFAVRAAGTCATAGPLAVDEMAAWILEGNGDDQ